MYTPDHETCLDRSLASWMNVPIPNQGGIQTMMACARTITSRLHRTQICAEEALTKRDEMDAEAAHGDDTHAWASSYPAGPDGTFEADEHDSK